MSLEEDLNAMLARPEAPELPSDPRGWEPTLELDVQAGVANFTAATAPVGEAAERRLLEQYDLDPAEWMVAKVTFTSERNWVRAVRRPGVGTGPGAEELAELRRQISLLEPLAPAKGGWLRGGGTFVVCLADWQTGKGEGGGSAATVARIRASVSAAVCRLEELRRMGRRVGRVALIGLGDLVEGCDGWYAMQAWQTDLTRREQINVVRRLLLWTLRKFAEAGLPVLVATVAGNHGENRKKGKAFTTFGDNDDVAVFEQVADVVQEAPDAFGSPTFAIPGDDLSLALDLSGTRVGIVHGHQFGNGATASAKALNWWQKQSLGDQAVGAAQILLSGHLHHFTCSPHGARTHFQAPSLDGGSRWYREVAGVDSPSGLLTLLVGAECGALGWSDLQLL